jgi:hypothetical protein
MLGDRALPATARVQAIYSCVPSRGSPYPNIRPDRTAETCDGKDLRSWSTECCELAREKG